MNSSIDLRRYVIAQTGTWSENGANFQPTLLRLVQARDGVTLVGPLRVRVCVQALNRFDHLTAKKRALEARDIFGYTLDIPAGQSWSYPAPEHYRLEALAEASAGSQGTLELLGNSSEASGGTGTGSSSGRGMRINTNVDSLSEAPASSGSSDIVRLALASRTFLGTNSGVQILIRPAGPEVCGDPCGTSNPCSDDPCAPKSACGCDCGCSSCSGGKAGGCGCGGSCSCTSSCNCGGCSNNSDLPCDFAVKSQSSGSFFPSACEPCAPGAPVSMPPTKGPALLVPPAAGGTIRTRFYNGMHIGKEDFETDQKNVRLKRALMNRTLGQGVAWGLGVSLDGDAICVTPGYGLDCCGNDIVLSQSYRVDASALASDPAAAALVAARGPQRASLVLEYFECPQDVRPVHGDPCTTDGARCEPSRIRETVRLRLAPPCDVDDSGPIKTFLGEIDKLRDDPTLAELFKTGPCPAPGTTASGSTGDTVTPAAQVPFTVGVQVVINEHSVVGSNAHGNLTPPVAPQSDLQDDVFVDEAITGGNNELNLALVARITVNANTAAGFHFAMQGGAPATGTPTETLTWTPPGQPAGTNTLLSTVGTPTDSQIVWDVPLPNAMFPLASPSSADPIPAALATRLSNWRMVDAQGDVIAGSTDIQLTPLDHRYWVSTPWGKSHASEGANARYVLHVDIPPSNVKVIPAQTQPGTGTPFPCMSEACNPDDYTFWATFPWLHANPENPCEAGDWRVLLLAVMYSILAGEMVQTGYGTEGSVDTGKLHLASAAYAAAWKLFFGTYPDTEKYSLTDALQRLLQAWCRSLLYPGPTCRCCPHGVVIGCAVVEGGAITHVDPWGGRRWVVQYPLLSYWGQQFGLMPLDAVASRLFDMICCFSSLPEPKFTAQLGGGLSYRMMRAPGVRPTESIVGRSSMMTFGHATFVVDDPEAVSNRVAMLSPVRSETLSPFDFVTRIGTMIRAAGSVPPGTPMVDYSVTGFPHLHVLAPEPAAGAPRSGGTPTAGSGSGGGGGPAGGGASRPGLRLSTLETLVGNEVASRTGKGAPPRLLRPTVESLSRSIAAQLPLDAPETIAAGLSRAGIHTVGDLLGADPEVVLQSALKGKNADEFSSLLDDAEKRVRSVVKAAGDAVALAAGDKEITTRADLRKGSTAATFTKLLAEKLKSAKVDVPASTAAAAVSDAAQG